MARPTKEKVSTEIVEEIVTPVDEISAKLSEKDREIAEMKEMILKMQSMMLNQQSQAVKTDDDDFVNMYKSIKVVSLYHGTLNLTTGGMGQGKLYQFNKFGEMRNIIYNDLRDLVSFNLSFAREGFFYILDPKVVKEVGLEEEYKNMIVKEQIEGLIENDKDVIVELFNSVSVAQQESMVDHIVSQMVSGVEFDLNKVATISSIYGKDIVTMVKDLKFIYDSEKK